MKTVFDPFDYQDVASHADAIVGALRSGKMPCDGAWPECRDPSARLGAGKGTDAVFRYCRKFRASSYLG